MHVRTLLSVVGLLARARARAFLFPQIASIVFLNLANASISRSAVLPLDAPDRKVELDAASSLIDRAETFATSPRLALARARTELLLGNPERAVNAFRGNAVMDSISEFIWADAAWQAQAAEIAETHWRRAGAIEYYMQEAYRKSSAHDWKTAANLAWIASLIEPTKAEAHYVWADAISHQTQPTAQVYQELDRALELTHDNEFRSTILSRKGELFSEQGSFEDALSLFGQARSVAPIDARPRTGYALTLLRLRPDSQAQATALLELVVGDSPWYSAAYVALSGISESRGDGKGAEHWLQVGLDRNKNDARLLTALGELYIRQQRFAEARERFALALGYETHADELQYLARRLVELKAQ